MLVVAGIESGIITFLIQIHKYTRNDTKYADSSATRYRVAFSTFTRQTELRTTYEHPV